VLHPATMLKWEMEDECQNEYNYVR
jgi:hypothetical protein